MPARDGVLDAAHVDAVLVRSHLELQRLHEEFLMGHRVAAVLRPLFDGLRAAGAPRPFHLVDLGCGLGFVLRWLARHRALGPDVTLTGADYNAAFGRAARRLAAREALPVRFVTGNAFRLAAPDVAAAGTAVFTSTGVLHHFRGASLAALFAQHRAACGAAAAVHFDIKPTLIAPVGAWIFHQARMREPLARHDGTLSAVRAHPDDVLLEALAAGARAAPHGVGQRRGPLRLARIMHAAVAISPAYEGAFRAALGADARRLGRARGRVT